MRKPGRTNFDISALREKLGREDGKTYWKSLGELADTPEFQDYLAHEFPANAEIWKDGVGRRRFIQLMGASLALAGISACTTQPTEKIIPYVRAPENMVPGEALYFATAMPFMGFGQGLLVESHAGRPTKVEGNPDHPGSLGAASAFAQASVLDLYDPDRSKVLRYRGQVQTWDLFLGAIRTELDGLEQGQGLRVLCGSSTSPTLKAQKEEFARVYPEAEWHTFEPAILQQGGGAPGTPSPASLQYHFERADVILSLDSDFLYGEPASVRYARDFASRRVPDAEGGMSRVYVIESTPTVTGTMADHRLSVQATRIEQLTEALAEMLGGSGETTGELSEEETRFLEAVVEDLQAAGSRALVVPGRYQSRRVSALALRANRQLGAIDTTVTAMARQEIDTTDSLQSLSKLVTDMQAGDVRVLAILGGNPAYDTPVDLDFAGAMASVNTCIHLTLQENETSSLSQWVIPRSHYLEGWSDIRYLDGSAAIIQPLIDPLYPSKNELELMEVLLGKPAVGSYDIVRTCWQENGGFSDFEKDWQRALHEGVVTVDGLSVDGLSVDGLSVDGPSVGGQPVDAGSPAPESRPPTPDSLEVIFRPDYSVFDGRYLNNGWLQETPDPLTKLTWDNAALISPRTAEELELQNENVVELSYRGRTITAPVWILPGQPDNSVTLPLGYGREQVGRVGRGSGFNAYQLQTSDSPWHGSGLTVRKTGEHYPLACTQDHHSMEGRHLVRSASLDAFEEHPEMIQEEGHHFSDKLDLYPEWDYEGYAWGMAVDLSKCTGCNACVVACQAENNIPIVGKEEVQMGREMHWIRVDRYFQGSLDDPEVLYQPVMCQHCEKAPCEVVCPVAATVHSSEGLNEMVYNRCVGTRYCSNNCPYKVRRFNFLLYSDWNEPSLKLQRNPDVTVRSRGVMEKCSYCVQRINTAKIQADLEDRVVADGEIKPACQQTCPADAIVFGDVSDPDTRVSGWKSDHRNYAILTELNTQPRTSYLGRIRNRNPKLKQVGDGQH